MPRRSVNKNKEEVKEEVVDEVAKEVDTSKQQEELAKQMQEFETMKKELAKQMEELKKEKTQIEKEKKAIEESSMPTARKKKELPKIDRSEMILCRNIVEGSLSYTSQKSGLTTRWSNYGDEEWIEFGELMTMKSSQPRILTEPWIAITDDDAIQYLGLSHVYENIIPVDELDEFFKKEPKEIARLLDKAPNGTKSLVATKARKLVSNEELFDNRVIKVLETKLQIDLSMVQD